MALTETIPPITGIDDPSQARVVLYQAGRTVHAPLDNVALLTDSEAAATYRLLSTTVFTNIKVTVFTASGTFTPDANMVCCEVWAWGGGGAGGGAPATGAGQGSVGASGRSGAMAYARLTAADIGASKAVTIGAGGTGVSGTTGNNGSITTLGSLVSAAGGAGGSTLGAHAADRGLGPSAAGQSATGDIRGWTRAGTWSTQNPAGTIAGNAPGLGGETELGGGGSSSADSNGGSGAANTGGGGGGTTNSASLSARTGGAGGSGLLIVKEYLKA